MNDDVSKAERHNAGPHASSAEVPVYNCHARLSVPDAEGWITARCCNLPEVFARGKTQREALAALVAGFKAAVSRYRASAREIPWIEVPAAPLPGEQERWIAVHL